MANFGVMDRQQGMRKTYYLIDPTYNSPTISVLNASCFHHQDNDNVTPPKHSLSTSEKEMLVLYSCELL